jgi:hypothetical protein
MHRAIDAGLKGIAPAAAECLRQIPISAAAGQRKTVKMESIDMPPMRVPGSLIAPLIVLAIASR